MATRSPVHAKDPVTSNLAALHMEQSGKRATHAAQVLAVVREKPGLCAEVIGELTGLGRVEAARRLSDLRADSYVDRKGRITFNGTSQSLWFPVIAEPRQERIIA